MSFLDIGGAGGRFLESINRNVCEIDGTVLDMDTECLEYGRQQFPHIKFIYGEFPNVELSKKYDFVCMNALFPHMLNWKECLFKMAELSKNYIVLSNVIRLTGNTLADIDTSYFYYLNTGKRVPQVIHNIYQFINFLCLQEMRVQRIVCSGSNPLGFHNPSMLDDFLASSEEDDELSQKVSGPTLDTHTFRGTSLHETIQSTWVIKLFSEEDNPLRMGGAKNVGKEFEEYKFFIPDIFIVLNDKPFLVVENGIRYDNAKRVYNYYKEKFT